MKTTHFKNVLSAIICIVLVAAIALITTGCIGNKEEPETTTIENVSSQVTTNEENSSQVTVLGEGKTQFNFTVVDIDGNATDFEIHTDKKFVGEALVESELINGEEGPYGLYVKEVLGISADYEKDGVYWGFFADGKQAPMGADMTEIVPGTHYSFEVTK